MAKAIEIGAAIRQLRLAAGLKQRELAERVGVDATYVSHLEANRREPSIDLLRRIARELDAPPGLLLAICMATDLPVEHKAQYDAVIKDLLDLAVVSQTQMWLDA